MVFQTRTVALQGYQNFVSQPENVGRLCELINGEIIEVSPRRTSNSFLGHLVAVAVHLFCREHNLPCHTSGGDGAYWIDGHVLAPDFAYKQTSMQDTYPDPEPPLWVVEIISPTDKAADIREKRQIYLEAGILLWEIYPQSRSIDVYTPHQPVRTLHINDVLDVASILPGFTLRVIDILK